MGVEYADVIQSMAGFLAMVIGWFWASCFIKGMITEGVPPLDFSEGIGEVDDQDLFAVATGNEEYLAAHATVTPIKTKKKKEPKKTSEKSEKLEKLLEDCVGCLVALGEKKTSARKIVKDFFTKNPNTKTVDEFINGVFKK